MWVLMRMIMMSRFCSHFSVIDNRRMYDVCVIALVFWLQLKVVMLHIL